MLLSSTLLKSNITGRDDLSAFRAKLVAEWDRAAITCSHRHGEE
jgi:hypothetical protein